MKPMADISILKAEVSLLDAKAWAYIGRRAICGDSDAQSLINLLESQDELDTLRSIEADRNLEEGL
jgi:hypothetical protein